MDTTLAILREVYAATGAITPELRALIKATLDTYDAGEPWPHASKAFREEHPWCGWTMAFAHGSDWDTTSFGLERLVNLNVLLTTADGRSRPVSIIEWQEIDPAYAAASGDCDRKAGIAVRELDTDNYEPLDKTAAPELVPYEDIREIVVY